MRKTLLICSHYPLPENIGANIRTMNFVRFFRNRGSIDIAYSYLLPGEKAGNSIFANEYFLGREVVESLQDRLIRWTKIKSRPLPISTYNDVSEKQLLSVIESNDYNYIFVRYVNNTSSLFKLPAKYRIRTIIDFDDISSVLYESKIGSVNGLFRKLRLHLNRKFLINYEKKCLNFGASLFCSKEDMAKVIGKSNRTNIFVIPNIYHNESFEDYSFGDGFANEDNLLFVGTLNYEPNINGLKWFVSSVFPDFKKEFPGSKLLVVGRFPHQDVKKLCELNTDVELYEDVPDVREFYKKCKAVIVPLLTGSGTRIKILEAALANRPVLSTPIGAEGLDLTEETDLLQFENTHQFSAQYRKLRDRDRYDSLIQSAKKQVLTKYSIKTFKDAMERVLIELDNKKYSIEQ